MWNSPAAILACFIVCGADTLVKIILKKVGTIEIIFIRYGVLIMVSFVSLKRKKQSLRTVKKKVHLILWIISICRAPASYLRYYALTYISLVDNTVMMFTKLIFVIFISCVFLKERPDIFDGFSTIPNICGTLLVCHPQELFGIAETSKESSERLVGLMIALLSSSITACYICVLRYAEEVPVSYILLLQSVVGFVEGGFLLLMGFRFPYPNGKQVFFLRL